MAVRLNPRIVFAALLILLWSGCGGSGGGDTSHGNGGAGGLSISLLAPSTVMVGIPNGLVAISGQGFTEQSQVLVDGQPAMLTVFDSTSMVHAEIDTSLNAAAGTHQFSVQDGAQVSNPLPYTVYTPQQGPFVMQATPGFLVGDFAANPSTIVAADIDGDGRADVVMSGPGLPNSGSIAILRGQSDGTLATVQYVPVPVTPFALAVGDVNGNGSADLISITSDNGASSSTTVSILSGDGHGNFQPPVTQQTFSAIDPRAASLVDIDGDGKPDLILQAQQTGINGTGIIVWLRNTGGGFAPPITLATTVVNGIQNFSIADFNGDGKPDLIYIAADLSIHLLLNEGNGQFHDQLAAGLNGVIGIPNVIDFNLDGIPDVVVLVQQSTGDQLISFAGKGDGSFTKIATLDTPALVQLVAGDFDHDGFPDLAGPSGTEPSEILYFFGDGHGNFGLQTVVGAEGEFIVVGDFNGDGIPDVVVPDRFNFVSLSLGRTGRNFPSPLALTPAAMTGISTGDVNGDELPEIFVGGNPLDNVPGTVFLNQGKSSFQFAANTDPSSFQIVDMTGKGVVDLLGESGNSLIIWPNNKSFNFSSSPITLPQSVANIAIADMDGDGHPDIVSDCENGECPGQILYGNGAYQFSPVAVQNLSVPYIIGDFNGDGKPDIATGSGTFLNMGGRSFQEVVGDNTLPLGNGALAVVGDFNGDGKDDVAINFPGDITIAIYYSNGDGTFYVGTVIDPGQLPAAMIAGDFDGDGRTDLAVGLQLSQQACLLFNNGNGQFTRSFFASGANTLTMVSSDLNRNGKPDLIFGNFPLSAAPANVDVVFHK